MKVKELIIEAVKILNSQFENIHIDGSKLALKEKFNNYSLKKSKKSNKPDDTLPKFSKEVYVS